LGVSACAIGSLKAFSDHQFCRVCWHPKVKRHWWIWVRYKRILLGKLWHIRAKIL